ncbi:hypothetical protein [Alkalicoccus luteus]|uniref:hypothetical protein n=1 Tax=Alkalicoccus luteus TaxID=1237094 RepID=UPI00143C552D|nr:hypothetical protein [Alkalicoccus luteus]
MPFADWNGTASSDCADSTGTPDTSGKRLCLLENNVTTDRHDCFFTFIMNSMKDWHPYLTSKRLILGAIHMEPDRAFITST